VSLNLVGGIDYALEGVDASLGFSIYRHRMAGVQMAMLFNYVGGDVHGLQLAGGMNFSRGAVHGAQLSSGLNYAQGAVHGAQLGSLNIARDVVHGLQVGLVNYAKDVDFALGLVNIVREGRTHLELTGSSDGMVNLTLKHGGRHFHYMYGLLARPDGAGTLIGAGMGLGGRVTFGDRVFVDIDTLAYAVQQRDEIGRNTSPDAMLVQRLMLGVRLFSRLALVGGVSYSLLWSDEGAPDYGSFGTQTLDEPVGGRSLSGWPNVVLGLQVL
jgi:hypothetical protein